MRIDRATFIHSNPTIIACLCLCVSIDKCSGQTERLVDIA